MWYDVIVLAILIVGMVRGAVRGVVWQLAGIAGIVLCLIFAETISAVGSPYVHLEPPLNQWVVMVVAYLFFSFLSFGVARLIDGALEKAQLKEYNKHLGAIFGLIKGTALCLVITFFLVTLSASTRDWLKESKTARYAAILMDRLHPVMPEKLRGALATYIHDLDATDLDLKYADGVAVQPPGFDSSRAADTLGNPGGGPARPAPPAAGDTIDELLARIPGLSNDYIRARVREVYDATPPSSRQAFVQELRNAGPAMLSAVLQRWQWSSAASSNSQTSASGSGSAEHVGYSQPAPPTLASMRTAISRQLARSPQEQTAYEARIAAALRGLPDAVSLGVLGDWQADLTAGAPDPDPETTAATPLDRRIIRQLTLQRVSVFQLSQELQERLLQARQR